MKLAEKAHRIACVVHSVEDVDEGVHCYTSAFIPRSQATSLLSLPRRRHSVAAMSIVAVTSQYSSAGTAVVKQVTRHDEEGIDNT